MHTECKCKEFCSQTRLGGEICSADVNTHKGHYNFKADSYLGVSLSLSLDERKKGEKERTGLALRHQSLACHTRFALASMRKTKLLRRRQTLKVVKEITWWYCGAGT